VKSEISPAPVPHDGIRTYSLLRCLRHLPNRDCWSRASQRCACLPSLNGLRMSFLFVSTVPMPRDVVSLPSLHPSRKTSLRLTNRLHQLACKGLSPSRIIWYLGYQMPMLGTHKMLHFQKTLLTKPKNPYLMVFTSGMGLS
jgi:hypothetical protein